MALVDVVAVDDCEWLQDASRETKSPMDRQIIKNFAPIFFEKSLLVTVVMSVCSIF